MLGWHDAPLNVRVALRCTREWGSGQQHSESNQRPMLRARVSGRLIQGRRYSGAVGRSDRHEGLATWDSVEWSLWEDEEDADEDDLDGYDDSD